MSIIVEEDQPPVASHARSVLRRLRHDRLAMFGAIVIVALFVLAFAFPWYWPWGYQQADPNAFLSAPSGAHLFGTDPDGFDMYARVMRGLQKSLVIGLLVAVSSTATAAVVGSVAGYFRGALDRTLMWLVDLLLILPNFLILSVLSPAFRGRSWLFFVVLLAAFMWMITARVVRGMTLTISEREFVRAAKLMGVPAWRVIVRHILPQMSSLLIADATINVGVAILTETSLSYFGFGVQPPDVSLGTLIADSTDSVLSFPWLFFEPAGFLVLTVLVVNLVGDGVRDALDPGSRRRFRGRSGRTRRLHRSGGRGARSHDVHDRHHGPTHG